MYLFSRFIINGDEFIKVERFFLVVGLFIVGYEWGEIDGRFKFIFSCTRVSYLLGFVRVRGLFIILFVLENFER